MTSEMEISTKLRAVHNDMLYKSAFTLLYYTKLSKKLFSFLHSTERVDKLIQSIGCCNNKRSVICIHALVWR